MAAPTELLRMVPLFADLPDRELKSIAQSFKERTFHAGDVIAAQGKGGVGFFVIGSGEVAYSMHGEEVGRGGPGDYFGEIALIDDGPRSATVTAVSEVTAYGLTSWEFRPFVEQNASIAWQLLLVMAKRLRAAQASS
jgi:CRP/FNR family cyclic AMP-dependent transcriptional regulator